MKKKIFTIIAAFLLCLALTGCGEYTPPSDPGGDGDKPPVVTPDPPTGEEGGEYTVRLVCNDLPYVPETRVTAQWSNGVSAPITAPFDADGVARVTGLNEEYRYKVTLQGLPEPDSRGRGGYTYDPNAEENVTDAQNKDVKITVYALTRTTGTGSNIYSPILISTVGAYRVTLKDESSVVFFRFTPRTLGSYTMLSLTDTSPNNVNPKLDVYGGSSQYAFFLKTVDGGGEHSTYTYNFAHEFMIYSDEIGDTGGGVFNFGVKAESRTNAFPLTIDFRIRYTIIEDREPEYYPVILPEEFKGVTAQTEAAFKQEKDALMKASGNTFRYVYADNYLTNSRKYLIRGDLVAFNPDTGYYHMYDPDTKTFGAVLVAKISAPNAVMDESFAGVEYHGNKALTVRGYNYKVFIEGYRNFIRMDPSGGLSKQYSDYEGEYGYTDFCNSDGVYPVNEELKTFLSAYALSQRLFYDGKGIAELSAAGFTGINCVEGDEWLFACGYYR